MSIEVSLVAAQCDKLWASNCTQHLGILQQLETAGSKKLSDHGRKQQSSAKENKVMGEKGTRSRIRPLVLSYLHSCTFVHTGGKEVRARSAEKD
jgi:hypothetical protein